MIRYFFLTLLAAAAAAQSTPPKEPYVPKQEFIVHGFRSPSIGAEYRRKWLAVHAGLYTTIVSPAEGVKEKNTQFFKVGTTSYFLPFHLRARRKSELFFSSAYLRGLNNGWRNAMQWEPGVRIAVTDHLDLRLGASLLRAKDKPFAVNPTIGVSYTFHKE